MLKRLRVRNYKSLADVTVELPRMSVLFGPNAAGKSNLLDAIQALSRIATQRTLSEALEGRTIRGHAFEQFGGGAAGRHSDKPENQFSIEADLSVLKGKKGIADYRYRVEVGITYGSGVLANRGEHLSALSKAGEPKGAPAIETNDDILIRRTGRGRPRKERLGINYAIMSDPRLASPGFRGIESVRTELQDWKGYHLDPRLAMLAEMPPMDVSDIGLSGELIGPFLYKLKGEHPNYFEAVRRTVRTIIPGVSGFDVNLTSRGTLDFVVQESGVAISSRIASEGTLRVVALCALCLNPWNGSLLTFEEPESGVHPRRVELIAKMLASLALDEGRQVVVTTHSPLFCGAVLREARSRDTDDIGLFMVRRDGIRTAINPFKPPGPLFEDRKVAEALRLPTEEHIFESLTLRGFLDG